METHWPKTLGVGGFERGDSMPDVLIDLEWLPPVVPRDIPSPGEDESLVHFAQAVADHDSDKLDEIVRLIGHLAVTIE